MKGSYAMVFLKGALAVAILATTACLLNRIASCCVIKIEQAKDEQGKLRLIMADQGQKLSIDDPSSLESLGQFKTSIDALPPSVLPQNASVLSSPKIPDNWSYLPEVGNGHVATVAFGDTVFMNGLYNGVNLTSHRARIVSPVGYRMYHPIPQKGLQEEFTLDVGRGYFFQTYAGDGITITLRTYAHRVFTSIIVNELLFTRDNATQTVDVTIYGNSGSKSNDMDLETQSEGFIKGTTKEAEYPKLAGKTVFYMKSSGSLQGRIRMADGNLEESHVVFSSFSVDKTQIANELAEAQKSFKDGTLLSSHVQEWTKVWNAGRVDIEGDITTARINYAAFYYLYSSLPFNGNSKTWPFIGLSPGGLAHGVTEDDYGGHVFWDQDIWMFPGLALLHADFGKVITETRTKTLESAKLLAKSYGNTGAQYPWESAYTGLETCPGRRWSYYEIHVTAGVSFMMRQYWQLTHDKVLFQNETGLDLIRETAIFWAARSTYDENDDVYHINVVMPPDEWHVPVNDSAYTNAIAAINLRFANTLLSAFGEPENKTWTEIANKLVVPYDKTLDYHPEFAGYAQGDYTKQADVVMLNYPLMVPMEKSTITNDLNAYEKSTPVGPCPAMTWSIFLTNWLQLGDETKASELFKRSVLNAQPPFYVWSENSDGSGAVNFLTGMGGHLQSLLFGYGGCRIHDDYLAFNPKVIPGTSKVKVTGIDYQGCSFDLRYDNKDLWLTLTSVNKDRSGLEVKFSSSTAWQIMPVGKSITMARQAFDIRPKK